MSLPAGLPDVSLDTTLGATFIGCAAACIFFGFNCLQTFLYYQQYDRDPHWLKLFVVALWGLDLLILVFVLKTVYFYCVTNFSNFEALFTATWQLSASVFVTSFANMAMRCFFCHRVYILSRKNWIIPTIVMLFSLASLGAATHLTVLRLKDESYTSIKGLATDFYVIYGCALAADSLIACFLTYFLLQNRQRGVRKTNTLLTILIIYVINTGILTCLTHIATLITFATMSNLVYIGIFSCSTKCYYGAFLASLNARDHIRERSQFLTFQIPPPRILQNSNTDNNKTEEIQLSSSSKGPPAPSSTIDDCSMKNERI